MTKVFLDARRDAMPWQSELYAERDVLNYMAQVGLRRFGFLRNARARAFYERH